MAKFQLGPLVNTEAVTYRVGTKLAPLTDKDRGKAVKLIGPSQVDLAGPNDQILGFLSSVETGTTDGFAIGGVQETDFQLADTEALAMGTLVVVKSNPAKGTAGATVVEAYEAPVAYDATEMYTHKWMVVETGVLKRV